MRRLGFVGPRFEDTNRGTGVDFEGGGGEASLIPHPLIPFIPNPLTLFPLLSIRGEGGGY